MNNKTLHILIIVFFACTGLFGVSVPEAEAGVFSRTASKVAARKAVARKAVRKTAQKKSANQSLKKPQLIERITRDANKVAASGGKITKSQRKILHDNLPVVQRRGVKATQAMRSNFNSNTKNNTGSKKNLIQRWEEKNSHKWPVSSKGRSATPHHIIPLESGGANKAWNIMPTFGSSPNHSLQGVAGPHAKGRVLRKTIQAPRSTMQKSGTKGSSQKYRETDLGYRKQITKSKAGD